jgi:hypothetical protein
MHLVGVKLNVDMQICGFNTDFFSDQPFFGSFDENAQDRTAQFRPAVEITGHQPDPTGLFDPVKGQGLLCARGNHKSLEIFQVFQ